MVFLQAFLQSFFFSFLLVLPRFRTSQKVTKKTKSNIEKSYKKRQKEIKRDGCDRGCFLTPVWSTLQLMLLWISVNPNPQRLPNEA